MSDTSYFGQRGKVVRPDARGSDVELADFAGSFLWVEYAAPWCGPCVPQAAAVRQVEKRYAGEVVFLTVVTSGPGGYGDPATVATAAAWARRVGHDPSRVLAADLTAMTIPRHLLFSPEGHVLLDRTGGLSAAELSAALDERMAGYRAWSDGGTRAPWMKTPG